MITVSVGKVILDESLPWTQQPWVVATRPRLFYHQRPSTKSSTVFVVVAQSVSHVRLFATPWSAAHQASLSTISWSLLKLTHIGWVMPSSHLILSFSSSAQSLPASGSFPMSQCFASGGQSIGASASASVLPMKIQGWFPWGSTSLISLQSKGFSNVFSNTVWKHQFFLAQPSFWFNSHICTWPLEKPQLWLFGSLLTKWCLCFLICCLGLL